MTNVLLTRQPTLCYCDNQKRKVRSRSNDPRRPHEICHRPCRFLRAGLAVRQAPQEIPRALLLGCRRASRAVLLGVGRRRAQRGMVVLPAAHAAVRSGVSAILHRDVRGRARREEPPAHPPHAHSSTAVHPRLHLRRGPHRLLRRILRAAPDERLYGQSRLLARTCGADHRAHGGAVRRSQW